MGRQEEEEHGNVINGRHHMYMHTYALTCNNNTCTCIHVCTNVPLTLDCLPVLVPLSLALDLLVGVAVDLLMVGVAARLLVVDVAVDPLEICETSP